MNRSLGIAFSANKIYFTELTGEKNNTKIDHIELVTVDFDFEDEFSKHKSSQKDLANISSEIGTYLTKRNLSIHNAALSISTSQAFMITLPIDFSEGKQSINSKIYWELSNYFPDNYNDFVINTYRLNKVLPCKNSDDYLIIAVQKNTIEFIRRIFKICNLELSVVDIDHFSAEHSFRNSYADKLPGKNILFAGLKNGRVDYGYIENKKYKFYCHSKYISDNEFNLNLTRKIKFLHNSQPEITSIDNIYFYGDEIREDTLDAVRKLDIAPVEIINPFEGINATDLFLKNSELRKHSYKYSASCGAALRNLDKA
ncbi:MAG: pilus assembly protein PilM [Ignavibacteria bacterium]|nr:pilus assembly protein PilM [Ignavibacteria bacterium]